MQINLKVIHFELLGIRFWNNVEQKLFTVQHKGSELFGELTDLFKVGNSYFWQYRHAYTGGFTENERSDECKSSSAKLMKWFGVDTFCKQEKKERMAAREAWRSRTKLISECLDA